jgi:cytochrome P450
MNLAAFMRDPISYMGRLRQEYGNIVSLSRGNADYVFVFSPEHTRMVLGEGALFVNLDAESSPLRMPAGSSLSRLFAGLSQMNGSRHKQQRRLIAPALTRSRIDAHCHGIDEIVSGWLDRWRPGESYDLLEEMRQLTLRIAVKAFVGLDPGPAGRNMARLLEQWMGLVFSLVAIALPFDLPGFPYRRLLAVSEELERLIRGLIADKRARGHGGNDVLSTLLRVHDEGDGRLTDDELVGQTNFLFMAGHATTASALTWTVFLLTQHPRVLIALLEELDRESSSNRPAADELERMRLLDAVIHESLRLLPPVIWWGRVSTAPVELGPYQLPAGTRVISSAFVTHRLPELYVQPQRFLPHRWLAGEPGPFAYLPFSAGPRTCPGSAFAMMEMKLVLIRLLRRFAVTLVPGTTADFSGLLLSVPRPSIRVRIGARDRWPRKCEVRGGICRIVDLD